MKSRIQFFLAPIFLVLIVVSCAKYLPHLRKHYTDVNAFIHRPKASPDDQPFLKAHFKNGYVAILHHPWEIDTVTGNINGTGFLYNANRSLVQQGGLVLPITDISIFETNADIRFISQDRTTGLVTIGILNAAAAIACFLNPKACFGSCPTFYTEEHSELQCSVAEGFSNAIAPSLAYGDIDALNNDKPLSGDFKLFMKNEALETHCIDDLRLFVSPRTHGSRILHSPSDRFYRTDSINVVSCATHNNLEVTALLRDNDINEWYTLADSHDLSKKEEILLQFDLTETIDTCGLLIGFRQTLMTTYFIYSALGYMGDEVSDYFAAMESDTDIKESLDNGITAELGKIEVYLRDDVRSPWMHQGGFYETGPIAINRQVLPLKSSLKPGGQVKLVLNKGLWRIDYVGLAHLAEEVSPVIIRPYEILQDGIPDKDALDALEMPGKYLISMPASVYTLKFLLPESNRDYEIFLYAQGYYLEWMRPEWLREKDLWKLRQLLKNPREYLLDEAAAYKEYERTMEETFWNSRITSKSLVHENN